MITPSQNKSKGAKSRLSLSFKLTGKAIVQIALALVGLLILCSLLLFYTPIATDANLEPNSLAPGGTFAFVQLLKAQGYQVTVNHLIPSESMADTLVVYFDPTWAPNNYDPDDSFSTPETSNVPDDQNSPILDFLRKHSNAGGATIHLYEPYRDWALPSVRKPATSIGPTGKKYKLSILEGNSVVRTNFDSGGDIPGVIVSEGAFSGHSAADFLLLDKSKIVTIRNGEVALNRYIDQFDNAEYLTDMIKTIYSGKKIYFFMAASSYSRNTDLSDIFGDWVDTAWNQVLLLVLIIGGTLTIRFGYPEEHRAYQMASRELLQGIAQVMRRARTSKAALEQVYNANDKLVRDKLGISRTASISHRNRLLPEEVQMAFSETEHSLITNTNENEATKVANKLQSLVSNFLASIRENT